MKTCGTEPIIVVNKIAPVYAAVIFIRINDREIYQQNPILFVYPAIMVFKNADITEWAIYKLSKHKMIWASVLFARQVNNFA